MLLAFAGWLPLLMVSSLVADSFAGERERHTLETLLASRLPDRAILFGKIGAAVSYGWGIALATLLLSLVTVNVAYSGEGPFFFSPLIGLGAAVVGLLTAGLAAGAGVLVSLRAPTVRQAAQTMRLASMLLMLVPLFGGRLLPAVWQARLLATLVTLGTTNVLLLGVGVLILLDAVLLAAAMARFRRARLILD
jgi:ABC-2 type transport system permease protein